MGCSILPEITKEKRIKNELDRISSFFEKVDANQRAIVAPLLQNAAFMSVTLEDLQDAINNEGVTEQYMNGKNQYGVKQSATLQSYNALIKNFTSVIKTLSGLLPPEEKVKLPPIWAPVQKTEEERQREREEEERALERRNREIAEAVEYQRRQREAEQKRKAVI